jgi:two-component system, NarL family, nitrate/nitrite response regulator NarL
MRRVRVVIADRDPLIMQGLVSLIGGNRQFEIVACCRNSAECARVIRNDCPDLALIDIGMPGSFRLEYLAADAGARMSTRVIFVATPAELLQLAGTFSEAARNEPRLMRYLHQPETDSRLRSPAPGDDALSDQAITSSAEASAQSLALLTGREREIMLLVSEGFSNRGIGRQLNISEGTIKVHLHHIFQKLSITNRASLAALVATQLR